MDVTIRVSARLGVTQDAVRRKANVFVLNENGASVLLLRPVHRPRHIPHKLGQIPMPQQLPDGVGLAQVEPVMVLVDTIQRFRSS